MRLALMDAVKRDEDRDPGGGPIWANVGFFGFRSALPFLDIH
nr:hypothetical protein [Synechococcus sp. AH-603-L18]